MLCHSMVCYAMYVYIYIHTMFDGNTSPDVPWFGHNMFAVYTTMNCPWIPMFLVIVYILNWMPLISIWFVNALLMCVIFIDL